MTSVAFSPLGKLLSVGTNRGEVQIWDIAEMKLIRKLKGHKARVGAISWCNPVLASGSRDKSILFRDIRQKDSEISERKGITSIMQYFNHFSSSQIRDLRIEVVT